MSEWVKLNFSRKKKKQNQKKKKNEKKKKEKKLMANSSLVGLKLVFHMSQNNTPASSPVCEYKSTFMNCAFKSSFFKLFYI